MQNNQVTAVLIKGAGILRATITGLLRFLGVQFGCLGIVILVGVFGIVGMISGLMGWAQTGTSTDDPRLTLELRERYKDAMDHSLGNLDRAGLVDAGMIDWESYKVPWNWIAAIDSVDNQFATPNIGTNVAALKTAFEFTTGETERWTEVSSSEGGTEITDQEQWTETMLARVKAFSRVDSYHYRVATSLISEHSVTLEHDDGSAYTITYRTYERRARLDRKESKDNWDKYLALMAHLEVPGRDVELVPVIANAMVNAGGLDNIRLDNRYAFLGGTVIEAYAGVIRDGWAWPVPLSGEITDLFGHSTDPFSGRYRYHMGIDIAAPLGTPIYTVKGGQVRTVSYDASGYGLYVIVDHADGYSSVYAHLNASAVQVGQNMSDRDPIGRMGSTGYSTGSHLHFEIRMPDGTPINPLTCVGYR